MKNVSNDVIVTRISAMVLTIFSIEGGNSYFNNSINCVDNGNFPNGMMKNSTTFIDQTLGSTPN